MTVPYAPTWLVPSVPGQLSNTRGSNTSGDAIILKSHYTNPTATGDQAAATRISASRTAAAGQPTTSITTWDSGWTGAFATSPLPQAFSTGKSGMYATTWGNRIYVAMTQPTGGAAAIYVLSAIMTSGAVGSWRYESVPVKGSSTVPGWQISNVVVSLYASATPAGPMLYLQGDASVNSSGLFYAPINSDGSVGTWLYAANQPLHPAPTVAVPPTLGRDGSTTTGKIITIGAGPEEAAGITRVDIAPMNSDGSPGVFVATTALPLARTGHGVVVELIGQGSTASCFIHVIGGDDLTTPATTCYYGALNMTTNAIPSWSSGATLPAGRTDFAIASSIGQQGVYVLGGSSAVANTPVNTAYSNTPSGIRAPTAWTASTIPAARSYAAACQSPSTQNNSRDGQQPNVYPLPLNPYADPNNGNGHIALIGGQLVAGTPTATVQSAYQGTGGSALTAYTNGPAAALTAASLGVGATLLSNQDGSEDFIVRYGAFGQAITSSFLDGDAATVSVTYLSSQSGDVSPSTSTIIKIGQPPTITAVVPANASAPTVDAPAINFNFTSGAGAAPELNYRIQLKQAATVLFDTGLLYDRANSLTAAQVQARLLSNLLVSGTVYTLVITVTALDNPISASNQQATSTTTFTPSLAAASTTPTSVTAVSDQVNALVTVQWTNPGGSTATLNRVYYRVAGVGNYVLLKDNIAAVIGSAQSIQVMEPLLMNVSYDFRVTALNATTESAAATSASPSAVISPNYHFDTGGYVAMLSVAGNGPAQHVGLSLLPAGTGGGLVDFKRLIESSTNVMFGQALPLTRYGVYGYRMFDITTTETLASIPSLDTILNAALLGNTLVYRDMVGTLVYCSLDPTRGRVLDLYGSDTLHMTEVAYTYVP